MTGRRRIRGELTRNWGYGRFYQPTLERSMKNRLYSELGKDYKFARPHEDREMMVSKDWVGDFKRDNEYSP